MQHNSHGALLIFAGNILDTALSFKYLQCGVFLRRVQCRYLLYWSAIVAIVSFAGRRVQCGALLIFALLQLRSICRRAQCGGLQIFGGTRVQCGALQIFGGTRVQCKALQIFGGTRVQCQCGGLLQIFAPRAATLPLVNTLLRVNSCRLGPKTLAPTLHCLSNDPRMIGVLIVKSVIIKKRGDDLRND